MKYDLSIDKNGKVIAYIPNVLTNSVTIETDKEIAEDMIGFLSVSDNELIFDEIGYMEEKAKEKQEELIIKEKEEHLSKLAESVKVTREPSDKLGYDWLVYRLGEYIFLKEYVESESHKGTEDDPIPFELGIELIPNAFYLYNNELWVWMGARIIATEYPNEDNFSWAKWL